MSVAPELLQCDKLDEMVDRHAGYNKTRLFVVSLLALFTAGVGASLRSNVASDLQRIFFDPIDKAHSAEMIGSVLGVPFLGYAFTIAIGSPLLDAIGMGILLPMSGVLFIVGTLIILFASGANVYMVMWVGAVVTGIGWGLVETVINPLTTTLYPGRQDGALNTLHAWWPGGLIAGGLFGIGMGALGVGWQIKLAAVMVPAALVIDPMHGSEISADRTCRFRLLDGFDVSGVVEADVPGSLLLNVFDGRFRTGAGSMGGSGTDANGRDARNLAVGLRKRTDVRNAPFRGPDGAQAFSDWVVVVFVPACFIRAVRVERGEFADYRPACRYCMGYRRLLHVADDAGHSGGTVSPGWRFAYRTDGDGGHAIDHVCSAGDGPDLRFEKNRCGGRYSCVRGIATRTGTGKSTWNCGAGFISRSRNPAGGAAGGFWCDLVV